MKLVTIDTAGVYRLGLKVNDGILDIQAAQRWLPEPAIPFDVMEVIAGGAQVLALLETYAVRVMKAAEQAGAACGKLILAEDEVNWGPCVTRPGKIICVGLNYRQHAVETHAQIPDYPILFNKFNNTLTGHGRDIALPERVTTQVDYEAELVIVIGKTAKYVSVEEAPRHVFGYCCVNDLSARDLQMRTPQWLLGKSCDDFSPLGPYLVTADEIPDPNALAIKCTVNGELRQHSHTSDMIFSCAEMVSYISQHMTLSPGDIILTGTPEGVVLGLPEEQRVYLRHGDTATIEIEGLGSLTNRFVSEV